MIGVLGPVVTAPSMANNQLQQVRVLQEELDSLRPDLQRLQRTGDSLLLKLPSNVQETAAVRREVDALQQHLNRLATMLSEREKALLSLMGPSEEFYELINRLSDTLPAMQVRLRDRLVTVAKVRLLNCYLNINFQLKLLNVEHVRC